MALTESLSHATASTSDVLTLLGILLALMGMAGWFIYLWVEQKLTTNTQITIQTNLSASYLTASLHFYDLAVSIDGDDKIYRAMLQAAINFSDDAETSLLTLNIDKPNIREKITISRVNRAYYLMCLAKVSSDESRKRLKASALDLINRESSYIERMRTDKSNKWWELAESRLFVYREAGDNDEFVKPRIKELLDDPMVPLEFIQAIQNDKEWKPFLT